ncbi:MAG: hypothetical protein ACJ741_00075 [Pyrinomonadaceae bacterium]
MKQLQRIATILALLVTLTGGASVSAKDAGSASRRVISGIITRVDIRARTIEVREFGSGRTVIARVPKGTRLTTQTASKSGQPIERLLPGTVIRDVVVQP